MNSCKQNIEEFLNRNIGSWTGLKGHCQQSDVTTWFAFNEGEGVIYFGADQVAYTFRSLQSAHFTAGVFFYFNEARLHFIATEYWSFEPQECAELLQQLGAPAHQLDFYWRDKIIENGEWLYLSKGIAVGVIPATQLIAWMMVFPPCTLSYYQANYYNTSLAREFREQ